MNHGNHSLVALGLRLYRALARAFPHEFRNAYGTELVQVTEEAIEPVWQRHGLLGLARLLLDIAIRVPVEHLAELRQDQSRNVIGLVMKEGVALVLAGAAVGLAVAWAGTRVLSGFLSSITSATGATRTDPLLVLGITLLMAALALAACYLPARCALRIDPAVTLRQE